MVDVTEVREQIKSRLFDQIGKTVTLKKASTPTYNSRGELTGYSYDTVDVTAVEYNLTLSSKSREQYGTFEAGDKEAALPYDVSVSVDDIISTDGVDYRVVEIRTPELKGVVVNLCLLRKVRSGDNY